MPAGGNVSSFTQKVGDEICARIADKESLRSICKDKAMPNKSTVLKWLKDIDGFSTQYARARSEQAEAIFDEMLDIADESVNDYTTDEDGHERVNQEAIQRARLRIDTRKWVLGKMKPKKYGDKIDIDMTADVTTHQYEVTTKDDVDDSIGYKES